MVARGGGRCGAQYEVATPLAAAIHSGTLQRVDLHALIEAREIEAEPEIATLDEWRAYVLQVRVVSPWPRGVCSVRRSRKRCGLWVPPMAWPDCCAA